MTSTPLVSRINPERIRWFRPWLLVCLLAWALPTFAGKTDPSSPEATVVKEASGSIDEVIASDREKVDLVENSDVAEAVDRRPDLQFRNVTIDGEKATVSLSEIPANSVLSAEISKAATPDLDADTQGGGLNLRSKPTYDLEHRVIEGSASLTLTPYEGTLQREASFTYGQPLHNSGFIFTLAVEDGPQADDSYGQDWSLVEVEGREAFVLRDQSILYGKRHDRELNLNMTYDLKINGNIRMYFKADGEYEERNSIHPRFSVRYEDGTTEFANEAYAIVSNAESRRIMSGGSFEGQEYTLSTGAYIDYEAFSIDYFVSYRDSHIMEPDWIRAEFMLNPVDIRYDWTTRHSPAFASLENEPSLMDASKFDFEELRHSVWDDRQDEWIARINGQVPFKLGQWNGAIKGGGKVRMLDSEIDADVDVYNGYAGSFTIADVQGSYRKNNLLNGLYDHGPFPGIKNTRRFFRENSDNFKFDETRSHEISDPNTWTVNQEISASYLMGYLERGDLRTIFGFRAEKTEMSYDALQLETDAAGQYLSTIRVRDNSSYTNLFPGIHGRYDFNEKLSFIGSWTNTILRPHYGNLVPKRTIDHEDKYIREGNPDLDPTRFTNYNASVDYNLTDNSMLSLEFFRLELEDTIFFEVTSITEGPFAGYDRGTNNNGPSAEAQGLKLIWNQSLSDWWSLLDGFRYSATYTMQDTETEYPDRPGELHPMTGYADNEFEFILTYELNRLFAQLTFDYRDESLSWLQEETWRDNHRAEDYDLDFSMSWEISDNLRLLFDVNNLLEERRFRTYRGVPDRPAGYEWVSRHYTLGLRYKL